MKIPELTSAPGLRITSLPADRIRDVKLTGYPLETLVAEGLLRSGRVVGEVGAGYSWSEGS